MQLSVPNLDGPLLFNRVASLVHATASESSFWCICALTVPIMDVLKAVLTKNDSLVLRDVDCY